MLETALDLVSWDLTEIGAVVALFTNRKRWDFYKVFFSFSFHWPPSFLAPPRTMDCNFLKSLPRVGQKLLLLFTQNVEDANRWLDKLKTLWTSCKNRKFCISSYSIDWTMSTSEIAFRYHHWLLSSYIYHLLHVLWFIHIYRIYTEKMKETYYKYCFNFSLKSFIISWFNEKSELTLPTLKRF